MTNDPLPYDPGFDPADYQMDEDGEALPEIDLSQLPERNPAEAVDEQDDMDDSELEGLGAEGQIYERAVPRARQKVRSHASNQIGFCLREIRIINETEALGLDADESLAMCDNPIRLDTHDGDWENLMPRGFLFYFTGGVGNEHGHIGEILGNAFGASTDFPTGHWGRIKVRDLFERWGYARAYAANQVNNNVVRVLEAPKPPPKPRYPGIQAEIVDLSRLRLRHRRAGHPAVSAGLTRAIRNLRDIPGVV